MPGQKRKITTSSKTSKTGPCGTKKSRAIRACDRCKQSKIKCDPSAVLGKKGCENCNLAGQLCLFDHPKNNTQPVSIENYQYLTAEFQLVKAVMHKLFKKFVQPSLSGEDAVRDWTIHEIYNHVEHDQLDRNVFPATDDSEDDEHTEGGDDQSADDEDHEPAQGGDEKPSQGGHDEAPSQGDKHDPTKGEDEEPRQDNIYTTAGHSLGLNDGPQTLVWNNVTPYTYNTYDFRAEIQHSTPAYLSGPIPDESMARAPILDSIPDAQIQDNMPDVQVLDSMPDAQILDDTADARLFDNLDDIFDMAKYFTVRV